MAGTQASQGILQFLAWLPLGCKMSHRHIEEPQDGQELLGREGALASLDLGKAVLREPKSLGELCLCPVPLSSQAPDLAGNYLPCRCSRRSAHIALSILLSSYRYYENHSSNVSSPGRARSAALRTHYPDRP